MTCDAYADLVAAHVDGILTPQELQEVELHCSSCRQCHQLFVQQSGFHTAMAAHRFIVTTPAETEQRLLQALAKEQAVEPTRQTESSWSTWLSQTFTWPRLTLGLATASLLAILFLPQFFVSSPAPGLFLQAAHSYRTLVDRQQTLKHQISEPRELAAALNRSGQLDFVTQVADLRPAGYRLQGGSVTRILDQPAAVTVYDSGDDHILCLRLRGKLPPLSASATLVHDHYVYSQDGYTIVYSQFRQHYCLLISRLPREIFLQRLEAAPGA
ncbi:MAG: hypothetical protein HYZ50_21825 [Deltaproteobacteria bacterium]|nr:hypothetical protein [Deltaproteobacteria bacterium]